MLKKMFKHAVFTILCVIIAGILLNVPYKYFLMFNDAAIITEQEFSDLKNNNSNIIFKPTINTVFAYNEDKDKAIQEYNVKFKLLNLINVKNLRVKISNENLVYAGGDCVGIALKSKGVVIVGSNYIITKDGNKNPFKDSGLKVGDVVYAIDNQSINSMQDINAVLETAYNNVTYDLLVNRNNQLVTLTISPAFDIQTNKYKLGLWIREDALGVGTITFISGENNRFGALGHAIVDVDSGTKFEISGGNIYKSNIVGVKKGARGAPGELMGLFSAGSNDIGDIDKNVNAGIYGYFSQEELLEDRQQYAIGGRLTARPGKAKILACISGNEVQEYNIEIIKTNYQNKSNEKSMIIKITDKRLIEKTGGIVQGMSGSPIIQDNKIIGAVTHVFVNDPTKGFGLYLDWMLLE